MTIPFLVVDQVIPNVVHYSMKLRNWWLLRHGPRSTQASRLFFASERPSSNVNLDKPLKYVKTR